MENNEPISVKLTEEQLSLLKTGIAIKIGDKKYYFLPYWFEEDIETKDMLMHLDMPPDELGKLIKEKLETNE